jgi:membrane fusion protein (multidrug efflux system)
MMARSRTMIALIAALALAFGALLVAGVVTRARASKALHAASNAARAAVPNVAVIRPALAGEDDLTLAATTQGFQDTIVYARTSGYLRKRYVDLGDRVTAGQLLAEIESPELDEQLRQARADLNQAEKALDLQKANLDLATATLARYRAADAENAVAKEAVDQSVAAARTAQASVFAAEAAVASFGANLRRLEDLTQFERVIAPFSGIVTQRNIDVGALITAGSPTNNTAASPLAVNGGANGLFEIMGLDRLRVFVSVPQAYAPNVTTGATVKVRVRGQARPIAGRVARTANALDPGARTLLTEVDIDNRTGELLPGMFVYVDFSVGAAGTRWRLPAAAVIVDAEGTRVATVDRDGVVRFQPVTIGRDFGPTIDVHGGLTGDELIVKQPTVALQEGQRVQPTQSGPS